MSTNPIHTQPPVTTDTGTPDRRAAAPGRRVSGGLLDPKMLWKSLPDAFKKLDPRWMIHNPVMFVVEVGAVLTTYSAIIHTSIFGWTITVWLWLTVLFANLAEAVAEGRGKAQAETLRRTKQETVARRLLDWKPDAQHPREEEVPGTQLRVGDYVVVEAGQVIPGDGDVVEGVASVDESAITGESAPVIRESGGDRSAVTGGTKVLSDRIVVQITSKPGETFIDRMIGLVEGASRQKTPNEVALNVLLASLTLIFVMAVVTLQPMAYYSGAPQDLIILVALIVALIPTTIGALLSAIGIAGMDRLVQRNVLAMSGRAVEAAGDVNTLLLDKTGTITMGDRQATEFLPVSGVDVATLADAAQLASLADETPEGRSIVVLAKNQFNIRERGPGELPGAVFVPFTAQTRMSGVDLADGREVRKGAAASVAQWIRDNGGTPPEELGQMVDDISAVGGTPLVVAEKANGKAQGPRRRLPQGHRQGGHRRAVRRDAGHGHPHRHDHRRQPAHRAGHRRRVRRRRLPRRGDAGRQDGADQEGAGGRQARRDDRRRHQRRARARPGRRRRGHEHRHLGRERGREHGGPGLQPDEAHRGRGDRQAVADHPRRPDHLLHRQRRREVLRDAAGDVRRSRSPTWRSSTSCTCTARSRRSPRRSSSTR